MRWLAKRMLRGNLLALEDGSALYYHDFPGPGYIVSFGRRRALEGYVALKAWLVVAAFAFPIGFFKAWNDSPCCDIFDAMSLGGGLWLIYSLGLWLYFRRRKRLFVSTLELRDPDRREEDLERLEDLSEARAPGFLTFTIYLGALIFFGAAIGITLSAGLIHVFL